MKRRRSAWLALLAVCSVAAAAVGFAIASDESDEAPRPSDSFTPEEIAEREKLFEEAEPLKADNLIPASVPEALQGQCERHLQSDPQDVACRAVAAIADGRLEPGEYSDEQLEETLGG